MAVDITTKLDNQTGDDLKQIKQDLDKIVLSADDAERAFREAEKEAKKLANTSGGFSKLDDRITAVATSATAVIEGLRMVADVAVRAMEAVRTLGERGNQNMQQLADNVDGLGESLLTMLDRAETEEGILGGTVRAVTTLVEENKKGADAVSDIWDNLSQMAVDWEFEAKKAIVGVTEEEERMHSRVLNQIEQRRQAREREWKQEVERRKQIQQTKKLEETLANFRAHEAELQRQRWINEFDQMDEVAAAIFREKNKLKELAEQGKLTDDAAQKRLRNLIDLRNKASELRLREEEKMEQERQRIARAEQERIKLLEDARLKAWERRQKHLAQERAEEQKRAREQQRILANQLRDEQRAAQARLDILKKERDEKAKILRGGQGGPDIVGQIRGSFNRRQLLEQVTNQRMRAEVEKRGGTEGMSERDFNQLRQQIRREVFRQAKVTERAHQQGRLDDKRLEGNLIDRQEVEEARGRLLKKVVNNAEKTGEMSKQTADAFREAAKQLNTEVVKNTQQIKMQEEVIQAFAKTNQTITKGQKETQNLQTMVERLQDDVDKIAENQGLIAKTSPAKRSRISRQGGN